MLQLIILTLDIIEETDEYRASVHKKHTTDLKPQYDEVASYYTDEITDCRNTLAAMAASYLRQFSHLTTAIQEEEYILLGTRQGPTQQ